MSKCGQVWCECQFAVHTTRVYIILEYMRFANAAVRFYWKEALKWNSSYFQAVFKKKTTKTFLVRERNAPVYLKQWFWSSETSRTFHIYTLQTVSSAWDEKPAVIDGVFVENSLHRHNLLIWLALNLTSEQAAVGDSTKFGSSRNPLTDFSHDYKPMLALGPLIASFRLGDFLQEM